MEMTNKYEVSRISWFSLMYTSAICLAIGLLVWFLGVSDSVWIAILVSFCIGWSINLSFIFWENRVSRLLPAYLVPLPLTAVGFVIGLMLAGTLSFGDPVFFFTLKHPTLILAVFFSIAGATIVYTHQKLLVARARLATAEAERQSQEKKMIESELKLLQAQIEPHFLFNSLSNIVGLIRHSPEIAERSLLNLTTLLRASLQKTRSSSTTLTEELKLAQAYLEIQSIRMPGRLQYEIRPSNLLDGGGEHKELSQMTIPPLLLQPLLENAVIHGIEPAESGGTIVIDISIENKMACISVADTGVGIDELTTQTDKSTGSGTGLNNVRQRLRTLHGNDASMRIYNNSPAGVVVKLKFPIVYGN